MNAISVYNRCLSGKPYTEDFKIYSKAYLLKVLTQLESRDEFEKCQKLKEFIDWRFREEYSVFDVDVKCDS